MQTKTMETAGKDRIRFGNTIVNPQQWHIINRLINFSHEGVTPGWQKERLFNVKKIKTNGGDKILETSQLLQRNRKNVCQGHQLTSSRRLTQPPL